MLESDFSGGCLKLGVCREELAVLQAVLCGVLLHSKVSGIWTVLDCTPAPDKRSQGIPRTDSSFCLRILISENKGSLHKIPFPQVSQSLVSTSLSPAPTPAQ